MQHRIWSIWLFAAFCASPAACTLACEQSGMCSVGRVKNFVGDIHPTSGLAAALESCSYRKEFILLATTPDVLDNALQLHNALFNLGLAHAVLLAPDSATCSDATRVRPDLCCVWSSLELPQETFPHQLALWHHRRRLSARAVRLGYNTLVLDTDMIVFEDPYKYLKSPPFSEAQLITGTEHWDYKENTMLNLGFLYVQNAAVAGPVASLLAEVPDRQLRYAEDKGETMKALWGMHASCGTDEQLVYDDAVYSSALGYPTFVVTTTICSDPAVRKGNSTYTALSNRYGEIQHTIFNLKSVPTPSAWKDVVGADSIDIKTTTLKLVQPPTAAKRGKDLWPASEGGPMLAGPRGPLSLALREQLSKECSAALSNPSAACEMWPDWSAPAAGSPQASSVASPGGQELSEAFMFAPPWLVGSFQGRGRLGYWGQLTPRKPQQVIGHIHQSTGDAYVTKSGLLQLLGRFNWTLSEALKGNDTLYHCTVKRPAVHPRLVAISPGVPLGQMVHSEADLKAVMRGLIGVALLTGRTVLVPDLACSLPWVEEEPGGSKALPLKVRNGFIAHGRAEMPRCTWMKYAITACIADPVHSLLSWQMAHMSARWPELPLKPGPANIVTLGKAGLGGRRRRRSGNAEAGGGGQLRALLATQAGSHGSGRLPSSQAGNSASAQDTDVVGALPLTSKGPGSIAAGSVQPARRLLHHHQRQQQDATAGQHQRNQQELHIVPTIATSVRDLLQDYDGEEEGEEEGGAGGGGRTAGQGAGQGGKRVRRRRRRRGGPGGANGRGGGGVGLAGGAGDGEGAGGKLQLGRRRRRRAGAGGDGSGRLGLAGGAEGGAAAGGGRQQGRVRRRRRRGGSRSAGAGAAGGGGDYAGVGGDLYRRRRALQQQDLASQRQLSATTPAGGKGPSIRDPSRGQRRQKQGGAMFAWRVNATYLQSTVLPKYESQQVIYLRRPWIVDFPPEGSWRAVLPEMGRADVDVGKKYTKLLETCFAVVPSEGEVSQLEAGAKPFPAA